ncbi:MAG TPA: trypsin-like peptidase domain-containing protein, partial [Vicinamibacterales bacterium]|nr:trypsin-like peptidase domain-containing protein [Vicinamibacterales bacterium]
AEGRAAAAQAHRRHMTAARRLLIACLLLATGVVAGIVLAGAMRWADDAPAAPAPPIVRKGGAQVSAPAVPDFSQVAERTVGAVTNISSLQIVRSPTSPFATDPFFRYFFGDDEDLFGWRDRLRQSLGSGVVVTPDGYVLTNRHVIGSAEARVTVTLGDQRELPAEIVGVDDLTDLAVLRVRARGLSAIPWGDSDRLRVGEWVLAVGNPYSFNQTVTLGIVSALRRNLPGAIGYGDFIQTDAAINPGNSGGALVNARGELVGINTAIYTETGGYQGIGFAVPSNLARRVMNDLVRYGEVRRGSIGRVDLMPLTTQLAEELGVSSTRGAVIYQMSRASAAYRAGLRPGDVIVRFNGEPIDDPTELVRLLADAPIGSTARIEVVRDGRRREFQVPIEPARRRR